MDSTIKYNKAPYNLYHLANNAALHLVIPVVTLLVCPLCSSRLSRPVLRGVSLGGSCGPIRDRVWDRSERPHSTRCSRCRLYLALAYD